MRVSEKMNEILNSKKITIFLEGLPKNTKEVYKTGLKKFVEWLNKTYPKENLDNYIKDIRLMQPKEKIQTTDRYEKDIRAWLIELKKKYAPKTISGDIASLRGILVKNRIDLDQVFWKEIKQLKPGNAPLNEVIVSTPQELKNILMHSPDARAKAFFTVLATSGTRLSELCNLKMNDIKLDYQCPRIRVMPLSSKNKKQGRTRITPEAKDTVLEYLKVRKKIIKRAYLRTINVGHVIPISKEKLEERANNEKRLFPFSPHTMQGIWNTMLKKSGYDEIDDSGLRNRYKRNIHSLRKFFLTNYSKYNKNLAVFFMNQVSELEQTYDYKTEEWLDQEYMAGSHFLAIFESPQEQSEKLQELDMQLNEKDMQIRNLERTMQELKAQVIEMRLERIEKKNGIKS